MKCVVETTVPGTRSPPTPPGPELLLDFDKLVLLLGDHSSETIGNQRARDWMRDTGHERIISSWSPRRTCTGPEQQEQGLPVLFPGAVEEGGELGGKWMEL